MEKLPHVLIKDSELTVENFRNFDWHDDGNVSTEYQTKKFDLNQMETVDVLISHFDDFEGLAHIFLSFGFTSGEHIVVSLETRREKGEDFSPFWGMLRQFEIIYIVGSEKDIVGLRTGVRNERVYLYPTISSPEKARELFLAVASDINNIYDTPRIYNTLTHNCTNELTRRVEDISDYDFPFTWKTLFPGYFDEVLIDMGLVKDAGEFSEIKKRHLIDNTVDRYDPQYSQMMR